MFLNNINYIFLMKNMVIPNIIKRSQVYDNQQIDLYFGRITNYYHIII